MKNLVAFFLFTLSVNCFSQDSRILNTNERWIVRTVEDSCKCELPYNSYVALLNQEDENAPVATVLENNTGYTITWVYDSTGNYYATGIDSEAVVWVIGGDPVNNYQTTKTRWTGTIVTIEQAGLSWNYDPIPMNYLDNFVIEIRIY